jgi:hypothetical protein
MIACVVCQGSLELSEAHYANAWERSRKKLPCCSAACATTFDPDLHWIPAVLPQPAAGDEAIDLRNRARQRLRAGDEARPVVRELLLAGMSPGTLRYCVAESSDATTDAKSAATRTSVLGFVKGVLLGGRTVVAESRDQRSRKTYADATADLTQWEDVVRARGGCGATE